MFFRNIHQNCRLRCAVLTSAVVLFSAFGLFAASGEGKSKKGYTLKINGLEVKQTYLQPFSMRTGLLYKGSINSVEREGQGATINSLITYQKGNTTFIYPYKHKVQVPNFSTPSPAPFR